MHGPWTPERGATGAEREGHPKAMGTASEGVDLWAMIEPSHRGSLFPRIAVAVDGSAPSMRGFQMAMDLAKLFHSSLELVTVIPTPPSYGMPFFPPETWGEIMKAYEDQLAKLVETAKAQGIKPILSECRQGVIVDQILDFLANHPVDLVVVGARGLSASRRLILGSVSDGLVHHAPCPVLVVRDHGKPVP